MSNEFEITYKIQIASQNFQEPDFKKKKNERTRFQLHVTKINKTITFFFLLKEKKNTFLVCGAVDEDGEFFLFMRLFFFKILKLPYF